MCDVRACFTAILYQAYIWSSDWAPVVGTIYHLLLLRPLCYLYTRVQLQFLQDSSQAFHTKIVQINKKVQVLWRRWFVLKTELAQLGVHGMRRDCLHFGTKCSSDRDVLATCSQVLGAPLCRFKSKFCKLNLSCFPSFFLKASLIYNPPQSSSFLGMRQVDSGQGTDGW